MKYPYNYFEKKSNTYMEEIKEKDAKIEKLNFEKDCIEKCFIQFIKNLPRFKANWDGAIDYIVNKDENKRIDYIMLKNTLNFYFGFPNEIEIKKILTHGRNRYAHEIHFYICDKLYYIFIPDVACIDEENYICTNCGKFEFGFYHKDEKIAVSNESIISSYDPLDINNALKNVLEVKNG